MITRKLLLAAVGSIVMALGAGCSSQAEGDEVDETNENLGATAELRFDVVTMGSYKPLSGDPDPTRCPDVVETDKQGHRHCMRETEWNALDYKRTRGHFLSMPTDSHRDKIHANGNALAGYVNTLGAEYGKKSGAAAARDDLAAMKSSYGNKIPQWIIVNEISAGQWPKDDADGAAYRKFVIDYATEIASTGKIPVVCAPFDKPLAHASDWAALANVAYVAAEIQITGADVAKDASFAQDELEASVAAYDKMGVKKSRLMFLDNYSNTTPGALFGRDGVAIDAWRNAIIARTKAAANIHFAGYVSYAWEGNTGESSSDTRVDLEILYSKQDVL